jgi:hypothetical protein
MHATASSPHGMALRTAWTWPAVAAPCRRLTAKPPRQATDSSWHTPIITAANGLSANQR